MVAPLHVTNDVEAVLVRERQVDDAKLRLTRAETAQEMVRMREQLGLVTVLFERPADNAADFGLVL